MKLNCGPTKEEKRLARWSYLHNWHTFFALWPRRITGTNECRWFETIRRKGEFVIHYCGGYWQWEYSTADRSTGLDHDGNPSGPGGIED